jgi:GntR family transcriptional regulator/MocR family aminotransferase
VTDFPIRIERGSGVSLQRQLIEQLRHAILDGRLAAGTRLPSTRALATAAGVSRNIALAAYDELFAEGYVEGRHGSGTYVTGDLPALPRPALPAPDRSARWLRPLPATHRDDRSVPGTIEFRLGKPYVTQLPADVWRRVWNDVSGQLPPSDYGDPAGDPELRAAVAGYLRRSRGVACGADDVVITAGAIQALDLLARATLQPGQAVAIEEPGYHIAQRVLDSNGARLVPVPVDDDGMQVDQLPTGPDAPLLVYLTPSHQYPLGARMPISRRVALIEWARANDSLIVEDDYDSEFRFDAQPLPALAGLDTDGRVAYIGTFSKVLSPALRVGYLVAPKPLRELVTHYKWLADYHTPWPVQRALATFIIGGHLERHIRRMRRHYGEKRAVLRDELAAVGHLAHLRGLEAGLHVFLELEPAIDATSIVERARREGVVVSTVDDYYLGPTLRNGLLLGYGGLEIEEIRTGARVLAAVISAESSEQHGSTGRSLNHPREVQAGTGTRPATWAGRVREREEVHA